MLKEIGEVQGKTEKEVGGGAECIVTDGELYGVDLDGVDERVHTGSEGMLPDDNVKRETVL